MESAAAEPVAVAVRDWRRASGLSLERAGAVLGVAHTTVRDWERGRRPQPLSRGRLAAVLPIAEPAGLPARVRAARIGRGLTQRELGRVLGVAATTVSSWERGARRPGAQVALRLDALLTLRPLAVRRPTRCSRSCLARARRAAGLTQVEAARRLGLGVRTLGRIECGDRPVDLALVLRIARCYRRPVLELAAATGVAVDPMLDRARWRPGDLPAVLRLLRAAAGLSRCGLARLVRCSPRTVRAWEEDGTTPSPAQLTRLEEAFALPAGELRRLAVTPARPGAAAG